MAPRPHVLPSALLALCAACGPGEASEPSARRDAAPTDELARLAALGYADRDARADAGLAGVTRHDPARSFPGYDLTTDDRERALVIDPATGATVHAWRLPGAEKLETFELLEDGGVVVLAVGECLARLDRDSRVLWRRELSVHHEVRRTPAGDLLALVWDEPRIYRGRRVRFDTIVRVSLDGAVRPLWSSFGRLEELRRHHPPSRLDVPPEPSEPERLYDYYHANAVEALRPSALGARDARFRPGNLLVSLPHVNVVVVLDQDTLEVVWSFGPADLDFVHTPTLLENGHLLLFDNGEHRGSSRVLELEPLSGEVVWRHAGDPPESFFSRYRGSCQRLPNGSTLICESERGHVFELTPQGEVVWELWNPELGKDGRRLFYRWRRVEAAAVAPVLADAAPGR